MRVEDREERVQLMEPLVLGPGYARRDQMMDLVIELSQKAAGFRRSLPESLLRSLADLVRSMNCYYSNLIEGHNTHPIEIERALRNDFSSDARQRDLQREARAHIAVQEWIDGGGLPPGAATAAEGIREIHRRFCELLPEELLRLEDPRTGERVPVEPGRFRERDVQVGQHVAISPGAVPRFLERFAAVYGGMGRAEAILGMAAMHHRLLWMHPFLDGNGRVARLVSHAQARELLDTGSVWSIARGLARRVGEYKTLLARCHERRRNDLDGRGTLSEAALGEFTEFFLRVCLDQVAFMEGLMQPDRLRARILLWAEEEVRVEALPLRSGSVLEAILYRGELPRGEVAALVGTEDRQARRVVAALLKRGVVTAESTRAPLRLAFPAVLAERWMPGLFPA